MSGVMVMEVMTNFALDPVRGLFITSVISFYMRVRCYAHGNYFYRLVSMQDLEAVRQRLREFANSRDWDQFHSPKNLSMALSVEVSELVECFQWLTEDQSRSLSIDQLAAVADEIADIQLYLIRLADKVGVDIGAAVEQKIEKNEAKYPSEKVKGSSKKYSEYE